MPANITDVSVFTDPVQTVADGDAANAVNFAIATQALANRTRILKDRVDAKDMHAQYTMSGTSFTGKVPLTETLDVGGFGLASNEITVPAVGRYLVTATAVMSCDDTSAIEVFGLVLKLNGSNVVKGESSRFSTDANAVIGVSFATVVNVTSLAHTLAVHSTTAQTVTMDTLSVLTITRIS